MKIIVFGFNPEGKLDLLPVKVTLPIYGTIEQHEKDCVNTAEEYARGCGWEAPSALTVTSPAGHKLMALPWEWDKAVKLFMEV